MNYYYISKQNIIMTRDLYFVLYAILIQNVNKIKVVLFFFTGTYLNRI